MYKVVDKSSFILHTSQSEQIQAISPAIYLLRPASNIMGEFSSNGKIKILSFQTNNLLQLGSNKTLSKHNLCVIEGLRYDVVSNESLRRTS